MPGPSALYHGLAFDIILVLFSICWHKVVRCLVLRMRTIDRDTTCELKQQWYINTRHPPFLSLLAKDDEGIDDMLSELGIDPPSRPPSVASGVGMGMGFVGARAMVARDVENGWGNIDAGERVGGDVTGGGSWGRGAGASETAEAAEVQTPAVEAVAINAAAVQAAAASEAAAEEKAASSFTAATEEATALGKGGNSKHFSCCRNRVMLSP